MHARTLLYNGMVMMISKRSSGSTPCFILKKCFETTLYEREWVQYITEQMEKNLMEFKYFYTRNGIVV